MLTVEERHSSFFMKSRPIVETAVIHPTELLKLVTRTYYLFVIKRVKLILEQAIKAQRVSRVIDLLFL